MKKLFKLCLLILSVGLVNVSCSKDDAPAQTPVAAAPTLVGTWEFAKEGTWDGTAVQGLQDYVHGCTTTKDKWIFNGTTQTSKEYFDCVDPVQEYTTNYALQNNIITYTQTNGQTNDMEIVELTATSLKIKPGPNPRRFSSYYEFVRR